MKFLCFHTLLFALLVLPVVLKAAEPARCCHCCQDGKSPDSNKPAASADQTQRHPLKGVVTGVLSDKGALLVRHEEIPGYMHAMTMLFKVDPATLRVVQKGDAITATLVERDGEYSLEDVKPAKR